MNGKVVFFWLLLICMATDAEEKSEPLRKPSCPDVEAIVACPLNLAPVCGSDGNTYANECVLCFQRQSPVKQEKKKPTSCLLPRPAKKRLIEPEPGWHHKDVEDEEPRRFIFRPKRTPGVQLDKLRTYSPLELFQLFFSDEAVDTLCLNTNRNAKRLHEQGSHATWTPVDPTDIMRYIALLIYLGLMKPSAVRDMWRRDRLHSVPFPPSVMAGYRFEVIGRMLHMSDPAQDIINDKLKGQPDYDPLFRVKPLQEQILMACRAYYHPYQNLSIDERMVASKARHGMIQYMKNKPSRWGFKLFVLADSRSGYTCDFNLYQGKAYAPSGNGVAYDAVVNLLRVPYLGTGFHVYVDNFYTSTALFRHLHQIRYGACGTMRDRRIVFPRSSQRGDMRWTREGPLLYVKWKDMREVTMCTSIHKAYSGQTVVRRIKGPDGTWTLRTLPVPDPVLEYNKYMGGVDLSDALIKYFSVAKKTMRWYKKLFLHYVDIAVVNSYILYKGMALEKKEKPMTQKTFRETLCLQLADYGGQCVKMEQPLIIIQPKEEKVEVKTQNDDETSPNGCFPVPVCDVRASDPRVKASRGRRYCVHCLSKKKLYKTIYKCRACGVALCIIPDRLCFADWHDLKRKTPAENTK